MDVFRKYRLLFQITGGTLLAIILIYRFFSYRKDFAQLALGEETSPYYAFWKDYPIHLDQLNDSTSKQLMQGWESRNKRPVCLVLGNSQTHSINQLKSGDKNYPQLMMEQADKFQTDIITHSLPNANLQEFFLLGNFWMDRLPVKTLLIPVFMDDLREDGLRESFVPLLAGKSYSFSTPTALTDELNKELSQLHALTETSSDADMKGIEATTQEITEKAINSYLEEHSALWSYRPTIRGELFNGLYQLRNTLFNINAQTKRKMIPQLYRKNLDFLTALVQAARAKQVRVIVYIPPIRDDVEVPYDLNEYATFKQEVADLAQKNGAEFLDIDHLIPGKYWGFKASTNTSGQKELDFMHFQFFGHQLLADTLTAQLFKNQGK